MAPPAPKLIPSTTAAQSLTAAIFHNMDFNLSLEINKDEINAATTRSFLKVFL